MIDVTVRDFLSIPGNRGLVRMLTTLAEAGPQGLPSRRVGELVFNSRQYGHRVLKRAEELGYIERKKARRKGSRGHPFVMNTLTPKGRNLLRELKK